MQLASTLSVQDIMQEKDMDALLDWLDTLRVNLADTVVALQEEDNEWERSGVLEGVLDGLTTVRRKIEEVYDDLAR